MSANGQWGQWQSPAFIAEAGDSGSGKTTNAVYTGAGHAFFLCLPGKLKVVNILDYHIPDTHRKEITEIEHATQLVPQIAERAAKLGIDMVVVDDCSELMRGTAATLRKVYPKSHNFEYWDEIGLRLSEFRNTVRACGLFTYTTWHLANPGIDKESGHFFKGGPEVPGKKLTKLVPHLADTTVRCVLGDARDQYPWPGAWDCSPPDTNYHVKDEHGLRGQAPQNGREFLRTFCGYPSKAPAFVPWLDDVADLVATAVEAGKPLGETRAKLEKQGTARNWSPAHVQWAWRDGLDRVVFRKMKLNKHAMNF